jgi:HEAT repeat protein
LALETLLPHLADESQPLASRELSALSRLSGEDLPRFLQTWRGLSIQRRRNVVDQLADLAEDNIELDFDAVFLAGLLDDDVQVRADSCKALWEYEGEDLPPLLMRLLRDREPLVRSEAALALGRWLLRAELMAEPAQRTGEIEAALRGVFRDEAEVPEVRGRAIEALGCRGHSWVRDLVEEAYTSGERRLQLSAVHAMGRSADPEWLPTIVEQLHSDDPEMRFEAATAAGGLADEDALPDLAPLLEDDDAEVQEAAIAALGQIGGPEARSLLHGLAAETSDTRVLEAVSDALAEADFLDDPMSLALHLDQSVAEDRDEDDE